MHAILSMQRQINNRSYRVKSLGWGHNDVSPFREGQAKFAEQPFGLPLRCCVAIATYDIFSHAAYKKAATVTPENIRDIAVL